MFVTFLSAEMAQEQQVPYRQSYRLLTVTRPEVRGAGLTGSQLDVKDLLLGTDDSVQ